MKRTRDKEAEIETVVGNWWYEFSFMARKVMKALFMANSRAITVEVSLFLG